MITTNLWMIQVRDKHVLFVAYRCIIPVYTILSPGRDYTQREAVDYNVNSLRVTWYEIGYAT